MNYRERANEVKARLQKAKAEIAMLEKALPLLFELIESQEQEQGQPEATTAAKPTFGPSNERPVC